MRAVNISTDSEVSAHVIVADTLFSRMKGLLGRDRLNRGESLWIRPCRSIHTIGMKFPIDVVFLDRDNTVIAAIKNLGPQRLTRIYFTAASVLELSSGTLDSTGTREGDRIVFE